MHEGSARPHLFARVNLCYIDKNVSSAVLHLKIDQSNVLHL